MKWTSILGALFMAGTLLGQNQGKADSLRPIYLADSLSGVDKMELLRQLAFNEINNPNLALYYANELIELAGEQENQLYLYRGYLQKGNSQIDQGNLAVALDAYQSALEAAVAESYKPGEGTALMSLGFTYAKSGEPLRAAGYYERSITIFRDSAELEKPDGLKGLGEVLFNVGDFYLKQNELEKSQRLLEEAGRIFEKTGHRAGLNYVHGNQGILFAKKGDYDQAEAYMKEAIEELQIDGDYAAIAEYQTNLAQIYRERGEFGKAHTWAVRSLEHANRLGLKNQISESSQVLAELDYLTGNYREAYNHLNFHMRYQDSMDVETVDMSRLEREKAELELRQKENEIQLQLLNQKRQRWIIWGVLVTALLLIVMVVGGYKRYIFIKRTNAIISWERDRSENLLRNILPRQTALELKQNGRVRAQRFESVTILFSDFKGFTRQAESMDPENLVKSIDYYFSHFDAIMEKYGLEKIKTIGDAYMCAGGLPFPMADHAIRVVEAAMEMLEFVEANRDNSLKGQVRFEIRIGINSGPVVAGVVGTQKFAYDIWGDAVNIASRMESASEVGKINIADGTYQLIKEVYDCKYRGSLAVKNHGDLDMYFVLGKKAARHPQHVLEGPQGQSNGSP